MCLTIKLPVSRPFVSALASAFLRRPRMNSADLTGQRALETPNCFPIVVVSASCPVKIPDFPNRDFCCRFFMEKCHLLPRTTFPSPENRFQGGEAGDSPCAHRPVLPAYRLIGTASFFSKTFSR